MPKSVNRPALRLTLVAAMTAVAFVLTYLKVPLFAPFLDFEMSELPIIVLGIILGPLEAVLAELLKNLLGFIIKPVAGGVGQVANFIITSAYIVPLLLIFRAKDSAKRFAVACAVGVLATTVIACIANAAFLIPLYAVAFHWPVEAIIEATTAMNPLVGDYKTLILFSIAPFNILKAATSSIVGYFVVLAVKPPLKRMRFWPKS